MTSYRLHPKAETEFDESVAYYYEISKELGKSFVDEIDQAISRILTFPDAWQSLSPGTRRCRVNRFPYGIIYNVDEDKILIVALMHFSAST